VVVDSLIMEESPTVVTVAPRVSLDSGGGFLVAEGTAQQPVSGVWGAAPRGSIEEWEGLVVAWFDQSFAADSKMVLVDGEDRPKGIRKAQAAKGGAVPMALRSSVAPCKSAIRHTCVAPGEAIEGKLQGPVRVISAWTSSH
jgi:hypothetical protein